MTEGFTAEDNALSAGRLACAFSSAVQNINFVVLKTLAFITSRVMAISEELKQAYQNLFQKYQTNDIRIYNTSHTGGTGTHEVKKVTGCPKLNGQVNLPRMTSSTTGTGLQ